MERQRGHVSSVFTLHCHAGNETGHMNKTILSQMNVMCVISVFAHEKLHTHKLMYNKNYVSKCSVKAYVLEAVFKLTECFVYNIQAQL